MSRQRWEVVGGVGKGGILAREGRDVASPQLAERLATGAVVEELQLLQDRLQYQKISGAGPVTGWVSVKLSGKDLLVKTSGALPQGLPAVDFGQLPAAEAGDAQARCKRELAKGPLPWKDVSMDQVNENYMKRDPGMFYGLEFPWDEAMLLEFGASWLTRAFHAACTLEPDNAVTAITAVKRHEYGNNGCKTLFEVEYKHERPYLHKKLFAKYPFSMEDKRQKSDSLAQRVYKQPQDHSEINTYRLLEAELPVRMPKFYFGDISNRTTNFILILEQVEFADPGGSRSLAPGELEGPYDKGTDWTLRGEASEYYRLLVRTGARIAGLYKAGRLAPTEVLDRHFKSTLGTPPELFGVNPGNSGDPMFDRKLATGTSFMTEVARPLFPPEAVEAAFVKKLEALLLTVNAYSGESNYWRHAHSPDYVALTHANLNVDNAYFWRDEGGALDLGVLDWAKTESSGLGVKLYWWLYIADFETLQAHFDGLVECFIAEYHESGGPLLSKGTLRTMVFLTALEHLCEIIKAVPFIYKMCPKKNWEQISDRFDKRIFDTIDGKSTLRVYLHCWLNVVRMVAEWQAEQVVDAWVQDFSKLSGMPRKQVSAV